MNKVILLIILSALSYTLSAETSQDTWLGYFKKTNLNQNYSIWTETQLRYNLENSEMDQTLIRGGLLKKIGETSQEIGLLYAYIRTGDFSKEHRLALQHTMKYSLDFSHRIRFEYRGVEDSEPLSERLRYLLRYEHQNNFFLGSLVVWNEIFLNIDKFDNDRINHIDRNRAFVGFKNKFNNFDFEFGYLNQTAPRESGDIIDHVLVAYFFL